MELNLRAQTGATVIAVRRRGATTTSPDGSFRLQALDDVFLLGDDSDVLLARALLNEGPRGRGSGEGETFRDKLMSTVRSRHEVDLSPALDRNPCKITAFTRDRVV